MSHKMKKKIKIDFLDSLAGFLALGYKCGMGRNTRESFLEYLLKILINYLQKLNL